MIGRLGFVVSICTDQRKEKVLEELQRPTEKMYNNYMAKQTNKRRSRTTPVGYYGTQWCGGFEACTVCREFA